MADRQRGTLMLIARFQTDR